MECDSDNVVKEKVEESWSKATSLTNAVVDIECGRELSKGTDCCLGVGVEVAKKALNFSGESSLTENLP